jgi:hypothetical protein
LRGAPQRTHAESQSTDLNRCRPTYRAHTWQPLAPSLAALQPVLLGALSAADRVRPCVVGSDGRAVHGSPPEGLRSGLTMNRSQPIPIAVDVAVDPHVEDTPDGRWPRSGLHVQCAADSAGAFPRLCHSNFKIWQIVDLTSNRVATTTFWHFSFYEVDKRRAP